MVFLSIVIPVYNAGWIIEKCLDSIWSQGLSEAEYEVVCVNDNSTDNTLDVLGRVAKEHRNLRVVSNMENLRAGGARNRGVREAKGEYILFIDADDYYHPGGLKEAFDYQKEHGLDILMCDFARHNPGEVNNRMVHNFECRDIVTGREFIERNSAPWSPWKYMFRRSLMMDNGVFFEERVVCEDVDWTHKITLLAERMQYLPILLNHYVLWQDSVTASEYRNINFLNDRMASAVRMRDLLVYCDNDKQRGCVLSVSNALFYSVVKYFCGFMTRPSMKVALIKRYMSIEEDYGRVLNLVVRYPILYSTLSTIISPLFRLGVWGKRILSGR